MEMFHFLLTLSHFSYFFKTSFTILQFVQHLRLKNIATCSVSYPTKISYFFNMHLHNIKRNRKRVWRFSLSWKKENRIEYDISFILSFLRKLLQKWIKNLKHIKNYRVQAKSFDIGDWTFGLEFKSRRGPKTLRSDAE